MPRIGRQGEVSLALFENPHKRLNLLTGEWILVSPHRTKRPWQGKIETPAAEDMPRYDPSCYLCPGNKRAGGIENPPYTSTYSFVNDFSALLPDIPDETLEKGGLLQAKSERGLCKVLCFSPRHDLTLARMPAKDIAAVVDLWKKEYEEIAGDGSIGYVQIFENRGGIMGCSNPHPHGQIWADETVPVLPALETSKQAEYFEKHGSCLLCDYLRQELREKERIVCENGSFAALVPFWAVWPYEIMILPKIHCRSLKELTAEMRGDLAGIIRAVGIRYDNLFSTSFPYSMGFHQEPADGRDYGYWHLHMHYLPPLLRSATVRKFMVGYELLAMPQRDITAEQAAHTLRSLPEVHYLDRLTGS
ncbi:MAG: UDP-glucose--hexose-1-phosphate uridylyltransferase [Spirochaetales bacterium]|nr:MAG: UDP-glucose--hexose-1-phosphate uridylyltransferase [Spirochaetales bacterium]